MNDSSKDLTFHTRFERPAHGCLPLFVVLTFIAVFTALWCVSVVSPEPLVSKGVGRVSYRNDSITNFLVSQYSPLPLLQPWEKDPDFEEQVHLPMTREVQPMPAPALPLVPTTYDSAVLSADELLAPLPESGEQQEAHPGEEKEEKP